MTSNQKVTVLTTNGRRQNVPVTPNTTLLEILEQVCKKHSFKSNEHGLKHHNRVQDLTLTFRFSGLPNNCLLELFETEKPRDEDTEVVLCVQLENGERFQGNFKSNQTLVDVLNNLCKNEFIAMNNPVVFYMRQEIHGDSINTTNLKSLGITSGRAIVRLLDRNIEDLNKQAVVYIPPTIKPTVKSEENERKSPPKQKNETPALNVVEVVKTLKGNDDEKEKLLEEKEMKEKTEEKEIEKKTDDAKPAYSWGESGGRSMIENEDLPCDKTEITKDEDVEPLVYELGERNAVIFSLEAAQKALDNIPDSFFDLNTNDLKLLLRDLRKEANGNEEMPLLTAKLRELEESKKILRKLEQYKHCVIRIQFPDRLVLQGVFRPTESITDVHSFIKQYLKNPEIDFHLFTIPPKKILNIEKTLAEVDCVPTAILHFGVDLNDTQEKKKFFVRRVIYKIKQSRWCLIICHKI